MALKRSGVQISLGPLYENPCLFGGGFLLDVERHSGMAKAKRTIVDDLTEGLQELLKDFDQLLNPKPPRKPALVPVPVRPNPRDQRRNPRQR
jgi:hypothetical protein